MVKKSHALLNVLLVFAGLVPIYDAQVLHIEKKIIIKMIHNNSSIISCKVLFPVVQATENYIFCPLIVKENTQEMLLPKSVMRIFGWIVGVTAAFSAT